jgi:hypothetical protein
VQSISNGEIMNNQFDTHVYVSVRVKVLGTNIDQDPRIVADKVAEAVCAHPDEWLKSSNGSIKTGDGFACDIEHVEFAQDVDWILVDEINPHTGEIVKEHHFDHAGCSMTGMTGARTAKEGKIKLLLDEFSQAGVRKGRGAQELLNEFVSKAMEIMEMDQVVSPA